MKAVLLAVALFLSTSSFAQVEIFSSNIREWYAAPTSEYFVFQEGRPCTLEQVPKQFRSEYKGGYLRYKGKQQVHCWIKVDDTIFGIRDDGSKFIIPGVYVRPLRRA
jgi:hypothetical protein